MRYINANHADQDGDSLCNSERFLFKVEYMSQSTKNSQEPLVEGKLGGSRGIS